MYENEYLKRRNNMNKIVLASRSARRINLMPYVTNNFKVMPANIDETIEDTSLSINDIVTQIAIKKANKVQAKCPNEVIDAAHTLTVADGHILGKPIDEEDDRRMLRILQGRKHIVVTGVYICQGEKSLSFTCETEVNMAKMSDDEIEYYVNTGEGYDKAGGYAAQGLGCRYISNIRGDFFNLLGLPVYKLCLALKQFGVEI